MATFWKRELGALMSTIDKSSLFHKYSSLLFEILLNNFEQNLQSGQLYHWATTNGAEITTSLFAVIHSSRGTFEGLSVLLRECASISKYYAEHNMSLTQNVVNSTTITWGLYILLQIISLNEVALRRCQISCYSEALHPKTKTPAALNLPNISWQAVAKPSYSRRFKEMNQRIMNESESSSYVHSECWFQSRHLETLSHSSHKLCGQILLRCNHGDKKKSIQNHKCCPFCIPFYHPEGLLTWGYSGPL